MNLGEILKILHCDHMNINIIQILTGCEVNIIHILTRGINVAQGRVAAAGNIDPEVNQRIMLNERDDSPNLFCHMID